MGNKRRYNGKKRKYDLTKANEARRRRRNAAAAGTSGADNFERPPSSLSDDFTWPETDDNWLDGDDENKSTSNNKVEEENEVQIEQVKIEVPDEVDLGCDLVEPEPEPEDIGTILGSDGGFSKGFKPFVRATRINLPLINMFAVMEFIAMNDHYSTMDYRQLKDLITPVKGNYLLSGVSVQNRDTTHRVRCNVHLQTSALCGLEYDVSTHTVTRSECLCCPVARCPHVAALLMWLHTASNGKDNKFDPKQLPSGDYKPKPKPKHQVVSYPAVATQPPQPSVRAGAGDVLWAEPQDPLNVPTHADAKRIKLDGRQHEGVSAVAPPARSVVSKVSALAPLTRPVQSKPDDTAKQKEQQKDESVSVVKCSFTRKCFYNVWRSTRGSLPAKLRHARSVMSRAFHDDNYVVDFLPLENRLEELCLQIQGYLNEAGDAEGFETTHSAWFDAVENLELRKTKKNMEIVTRAIDPELSAQLYSGDWGGGHT